MINPEPSQIDKSKQAARDLERDNDEARFRVGEGKLVKRPDVGVFGKDRAEKP